MKSLSSHEEKETAEALLGNKTTIFDADEEAGSSTAILPTPASAQAPKPSKSKLSAAMIVPIWIILSSSVIIYNNYLYNTRNFKFPVFLVTFHLGFAAIGTRILQRTTNLLDGTKDIKMNREMFLKSILPIGILFSGSLILSNTAYLYLSVAYIQMLKVGVMAYFCGIISDTFLGFHPGRNPAHLVVL